MADAEALALLERSPVVHLATTDAEGGPILRTVHGVVVDGALAFHGAPAGEKLAALGHPLRGDHPLHPGDRMSSNATTIRAAAVAAAAGLLLTGCTPTPTAISAPAPDTGLGHVHGIVDLGGSTVLLGTHTGLYTLTDTGDVSGPLGGADFDAMGLTADGDVLYASGHPGPNTPAELGEHNLGLIRSTDAGTTWEPVAFTGQEDFHVLTAVDGAIQGIGSSSITIRTSPDGGTTWIDGAELPPADLTVTTDGTLYAATRQGLQESRDAGATFDLVAEAPPKRTRIFFSITHLIWLEDASFFHKS